MRRVIDRGALASDRMPPQRLVCALPRACPPCRRIELLYILRMHPLAPAVLSNSRNIERPTIVCGSPFRRRRYLWLIICAAQFLTFAHGADKDRPQSVRRPEDAPPPAKAAEMLAKRNAIASAQ